MTMTRSLDELDPHQLSALLAATRVAVRNGAEEWEDNEAKLARALSEQYGVIWQFDGWANTQATLEAIRYDRTCLRLARYG